MLTKWLMRLPQIMQTKPPSHGWTWLWMSSSTDPTKGPRVEQEQNLEDHSPAPDPGKTELSDLVIAAAAAKMVKLDPGVPEPTAEEFGAQYCRKVLGCCQRGQ